MTQNNECAALDVRYFNEKLRLVLEGLPNYTRSELARELQRLSTTASPISQNEQQEPFAYTDLDEDFMTKSTHSQYEKMGFHITCTTPLYTSPPKQIPDGWKLVLIEPDFNMKQAALEWNRRNTSGAFIKVAMEYHVAEKVYKAMINASPTNTEVGE